MHMTCTHTKWLCSLLALSLAAGLSSCSSPSARLDTKTSAVLCAMDQKLAAAKTLRVTASRQGTKGFRVGIPMAENAQVNVIVQRPDKLAATARTSEGTRSFGYDGKTATLIDHVAHTHASVPAGATIDAAVSSLQKSYGFAPPLSEVLANAPRQMMLDGVLNGRHAGVENIGGTSCDHLVFKQAEFDWDLWVGVSDSLPKRIRLVYPNGEGGPPLTMTSTIEKLELNAPVSAADFKVGIPAGSIAIDVIPLNR